MIRRLAFHAAIAATLAVAAMACEQDASTGGTPTRAPAQPQSTPSRSAQLIPTATAPANSPACAPPYPAPPYNADTVFCADPALMEHATVLGIVDGDTFDVLLNGVEERVRIFGIDTTERGEPCFREASDLLRSLAAGEVRLMRDLRNRDRNGRLLRYVYTPAGLSIDAVLIDEGLARAWTDDGALRDPLVALEAEAQAARRGCLFR
jgi:micrococcal nuclease